MVPVVYGYPSSELLERARRGEVALGGCVVFTPEPQWRCLNDDAHPTSAIAESNSAEE